MNLLTECLQRHARQQPERPALRFQQQSLSYLELSEQVSILADELAAQQCRHLVIWMDNSPQWVITQLAAFQAGLCVTLLPLSFSHSQAAELMQQIGAELLFISRPAHLGDLACEPLKLPKTAQHNPQLALCGYRLPAREGAVKVAAETALISFTAGTGGVPKGVCLSTALVDQVCRSLHQASSLIDSHRQLCLQPLSRLTENIAGVLVSLCAGRCISLASLEQSRSIASASPDLQALASLLQQEQPQSINLTPELLKVLLSTRMLYGPLPSLKFALVSGGKVAPGMIEKAQQLDLPVFEGYGLNECAGLISLNLPGQSQIGSVGRALPHCRLLLSAEGEIRVAGASMLGYLGENSSPACIDSGDSGFINVDGYLFISGRQEDIQTNKQGRDFSPEWIEAELNNLSAVSRACVFGVGKESVSAVIEPTANATVARLQMQLDQLNEQLPEYAIIQHWFRADRPFSVANGQLSSSGQIRREAVYRYYGPQFEALYRQPPRPKPTGRPDSERLVSALTGFSGLGLQPA